MRLTISVLSVVMLLVACGGGGSSSSDDGNLAVHEYKTLSLGHDGFDFASGKSGGLCDGTTNINYEISDGMTAGWIPGDGTYAEGEEGWTEGLTWIHFYNAPATEYRLIDLGDVSLETIKDADVTWPSADSEIKALVVGHAYIAQTEDGYVKFQVTDVKNNGCTTVDVKYDFSTSVSFSGNDTSGGDDRENSDEDVRSLWIGHFGSNFSEGLGADANCSYADVTIPWSEDDGYLADFATVGSAGNPEGEGFVWFNVAENAPDPLSTTSDYYIKYMGNVPLNSIVTAPDSWPQRDSTFPALSLNHVYVIKARDGYVKFKVKQFNIEDDDICINVDYVYSPSAMF